MFNSQAISTTDFIRYIEELFYIAEVLKIKAEVTEEKNYGHHIHRLQAVQSKLEIWSMLMTVFLSLRDVYCTIKSSSNTSLAEITKTVKDCKERHTSSSTDWNSLSSVERSMRIVPLPEVFRVRYGLSPVHITKHNNSFRNCFKATDLEW